MLLAVGLVLLAAKPGAPAPAPGPVTVEVEAEGTAPTPYLAPSRDGGIEAYALKQLALAIEHARDNAVRLALAREVEARAKGDAQLKDNPITVDRFSRQQDTFVLGATQLDESHDKTQTYVKVKVTLNAGAIDAALDQVKKQLQLLRTRKVLLAVGEQSLGIDGRPEIATRAVSEAIGSGLRQAGVPMILDGAGRYETGSPSRDEIVRVGHDLGADVVLTGTVTMHRSAPARGNTMLPEVNEHGEQLNFFVSCDYRLELLEAGTGRVLLGFDGNLNQKKMHEVQTSKSYAATEVGFANRAAPELVADLLVRMAAAYSTAATSGSVISVSLSQVDILQADRLEKRLKGVRNVRSVDLRGDFVNGTVTLEATFVGTAQELAAAITKAQRELTVTRVATGRIELAPPEKP